MMNVSVARKDVEAAYELLLHNVGASHAVMQIEPLDKSLEADVKWRDGGIKKDDGKLQLDLISGIFLNGLANVLTFGAKKYAAHNWRKGIAYSRLFAAMQRHLWAYWGGEELDPESGASHLDHAACCLMFLREMTETRKDQDDRYRQKFNASAGYTASNMCPDPFMAKHDETN